MKLEAYTTPLAVSGGGCHEAFFTPNGRGFESKAVKANGNDRVEQIEALLQQSVVTSNQRMSWIEQRLVSDR